jgi:hypothetical protein
LIAWSKQSILDLLFFGNGDARGGLATITTVWVKLVDILGHRSI